GGGEKEAEHVRAAAEDERHDRRQDDDARDAEERDHDAESKEILRTCFLAQEREAFAELLQRATGRRSTNLARANHEEACDDREERDPVDPERGGDAKIAEPPAGERRRHRPAELG